MLKFIDAHLHFFDIENGDYHWLREENPPFWPDKGKILRNFHQGDLHCEPRFSLAGYVHVEAGYDNTQWWREIEWLEKSATLPFRSVASADITKPPQHFIQEIDKLRAYPSVVGVRHILDENACDLLSDLEVCSNLAYLAEQTLSFDLQMPLTDTSGIHQLLACVEHCPQLTIILNHAGFPPQLNSGKWEEWKKNLSLLAKHNNIAVKCSGWEMGRRDYENRWVLTVLSECLEAFGDHRVMLASNFPLCLFSKSYEELWTQYLDFTTARAEALFHDNALLWYKF
ncbi:amidohydrolase family protein [Vibrio ostreicida]|uniref:Amidohydrolase family protein n=1 Tax=Vibrio ostreicida TaxID=526588 RepID=A0ABT8BM90_9VIBR|nr:amidohydrolase family protein [Vibrio ostreicida]MDN3608221.1 amidohydrolase family protein [Vibrio ostreicida]NPD09792.1 amidohydrolase family protein [Vibrio ostreicida]